MNCRPAPCDVHIAEMVDYGYGTVMHVMRLIAPRLPDEDQTKDMDFNAARIGARWSAGLDDTRRAITQGAWLQPVSAEQGLLLHDIDSAHPISLRQGGPHGAGAHR